VARHRPEHCSPNACPTNPRVPASLVLQAYRCGRHGQSKRMHPPQHQPPPPARTAHKARRTSLSHFRLRAWVPPSFSPAECILPLVVCASTAVYTPVYFSYRLRLPGRNIWDSPKMSLASGPAVFVTACLLEKNMPGFHPIPLVAGLARTNLVFDCSRAVSSRRTINKHVVSLSKRHTHSSLPSHDNQ